MQAESLKDHVRIAAVADLHCSKASRGALQPLFSRMTESADVLLLGGDLTDYGLPEEAHILVQELKSAAKAPIVAVLGNHDFESGRQDEIKKILAGGGVTVLDGDAVEVHGIGFAGAKGFVGGFGPRALQPWGEVSIKRFVHEAVDEALKLESGLARLRTERRVVLLHYSPILATVEGEPPEILPFLGSSRLEEPINRYGVTAVFHGHAHHGREEGRTSAGVPVYNVAMSLLHRARPEVQPFKLVEVPLAKEAAHGA
jgi:Icc-related predicted phosphoesterase